MVNNIVENNKIEILFSNYKFRLTLDIYSPNNISPNKNLENHISILLFCIKLYTHNGSYISIIFVTNKGNLNDYNFFVANFKETPVSLLNLLFIVNICH